MSTSPARRSATTYRWIRQFHLWIGAWGALAAILYGITGLVMNHRFGDGAWPQGDSREIAKMELAVPAQARTSAEALSLWLRETQSLDAQTIRKGKPDDKEYGVRLFDLNVRFRISEPDCLVSAIEPA